jgi:hypothetical protein
MLSTRAAAVRGFIGLAAALLLASPVYAGKPSKWEQVFLDGPTDVVLPDGSSTTVDPSCSGGPVMKDGRPVQGDTQYSFFYQQGNPNKLLVVFDGGGACWNELTCIGSVLGGSPTYSRIVDETTQQLESGSGMLDISNPANPYKEYTKVFVPYCTADVHWGSRDTTYQFPVAPGVTLPWTIRHRGSDNMIAVLDWLRRKGPTRNFDLSRVRDLTVTGLSAGAYGTLNGFGFLGEVTPRARHNVIADAGIGVLTPEFYQRALYDGMDTESWGVQKNLPAWVPGFPTMLAAGSAEPNMLVPLAFQSLSFWKPRAHLASITAELDTTQVFFYAVMKNKLSPGPQEFLEWYLGMKAITSATASLPNYRYFIEEGTFHTFLGNDEHTYEVGANGVSVAEWIRAMIKPGNRAWESLEAPPPF